jgi:Flp pilus assembly protein CpaB
MRRGRTLIFVFLIIIIGLVVAFVAYRQFSVPEVPPPPLFVEIYIAVQNIPQGGQIKPELLSTIKIAPENLVAVMFTVDEQGLLLGKVAKFPLDQGVVITEAMVSDSAAAVPISGPQWASLIPPGMTAISINTPDKLALAGYGVNTGAHVNVNACFHFIDIDPSFQSALPNQIAVLTGTGFLTESGAPVLTLGAAPSGGDQGRLELDPSLQQPYYLIPREAQRPRIVCQMLLQDVVVMRTGDFPLDPAASLTAIPVTTNAETGATTPIVPGIVTLIVSPQDSITLSYLRETTTAILSLTLRNPSDQLRQATEAATLQFLLSQYNIPVPAKLPYAH